MVASGWLRSDGQTGCSSGEELEVEILYTVNTSGYFSPCDVHIPRTTRGGKNSCKSPSSYNNKQPRALNTIGGCSSDNGILYVIDSSNILRYFYHVFALFLVACWGANACWLTNGDNALCPVYLDARKKPRQNWAALLKEQVQGCM